jgi:colanic acid/amylovoran biosynthesis glycosyltransferase
MHQLELEQHITLIGAMPQEDLIETLKSYDVLLLSSVEEGIANVVLEAMAVGLAVISTDCGGMAEVVGHKGTGWLVPVRDPQAIADAIVEVSETSELELQHITQNAHQFVKTHFNAEDGIRRFHELYERVMINDN